jgi:hypothetical protein
MGCRSTLITPIEDAYGLLDASANFIYFTYSFLLLNYFFTFFFPAFFLLVRKTRGKER